MRTAFVTVSLSLYLTKIASDTFVFIFSDRRAELLSLSNNKFSGSIREGFKDSVLDTLDLGQNLLTGTIPATLFDVPTIRLVYFSNNKLIGGLPANYGFAEKLRDLYVDGNMLQGPIPVIAPGQLPNLSEFLVQGNELTGTMPESVCLLLTESVLEDLWADCELVTGVAEVECSCCTQCTFEG